MLTVETVRQACADYDVAELVVAGGGTRNPMLMRGLADALPKTRIRSITDWAIPSEAKEAYAFATLGFLTVHGLPGTVPSCTGAREATVLGRITPGRITRRLSASAVTPPTRLVIDADRVQ